MFFKLVKPAARRGIHPIAVSASALFFLLSYTGFAAGAGHQSGVVTVPSEFTVDATMQRLEQVLTDKGMTIFTKVDHQQGAENAGMSIRPTQLLIFGNPKAGTPLMQCEQQVALDLPQKALIWEDAEGKVHLSYNDPGFLQSRHQVKGCEEAFGKVRKALAGITKEATTSESQ